MRALLAALLMLGLAACGTLPIAPRGPLDAEAAYTALYPYYLEFCGLSEIQKKPGYGADIHGGVGGHSTVYLNGACLAGPGYPELRICDGPNPGRDGVGLSVNEHFANANWVGIPGRDFFYHGDLKPGQPLTRAGYDATKAHARRLGLYDAIRFHDVVFAKLPPGYDATAAGREAFKYEISIGTDYAIGYARDRYCARVPMSRSQMGRVAAYLNSLNRPYRDGLASYVWSVLTDNCIHLAHNALTSIGFWPEWPTHQFVLFAAFDFPVPKNEFVNILRRANDGPTDLLSVWRDRSARAAVIAGDGLPTRPGALAVLEPATQDNALYNVADLQLIFYDERMFGSYEPWYRAIMAEPRYSDLAANRAHFAALYAGAQAAHQTLEWWRDNHPAIAASPDFPAFHARYADAVVPPHPVPPPPVPPAIARQHRSPASMGELP